MIIERAKQLAAEYGYALRPGTGWDWNLFDGRELVDTLHEQQILHLAEEDFLEYYL